jgi:hypothetical protein
VLGSVARRSFYAFAIQDGGPGFPSLPLSVTSLNLLSVNQDTYDALIIGCGPGGSSAATFLARAGKRVLMLGKEIPQRFHIGELLLPCNMTIFREMGVLPALQATGFPRKFSARFEPGNGSLGFRPIVIVTKGVPTCSSQG